jgi:hypothetical protein
MAMKAPLLLLLAAGAAAAQPIQISLTQSGVAGPMGLRWALQAGGRVERFRLGPGMRVTPDASWRPAADEMSPLLSAAEQLCAARPPAQLGAPPQVNPMTVALSGPGCASSLSLPAGTGIDSPEALRGASAPARRLVELTRRLTRLRAPSDPPPP